MAELGKNLQDLEGIVQGKQGNLRVVEDGGFAFSHGITFIILSFGLCLKAEEGKKQGPVEAEWFDQEKRN